MQVSPVSGTTGAAFTIKLRGRRTEMANGNDPLIIVEYGIPYPTTPMNYVFGGGTISSPLANIDPSTIESIEVLKDADATAIYGSRGANGVILLRSKSKTGQNKSEVPYSFRIWKGYPVYGPVNMTQSYRHAEKKHLRMTVLHLPAAMPVIYYYGILPNIPTGKRN